MPDVVPYLGYPDARAAMEWLEAAFAFEPVASFEAADGSVVHAEMRFREGVVMLGPTYEAEPARGAAVSGVYVVVDDVDAHYARAVAAGAEIVFPPEDADFGVRRYRARDVGGFEWSFGNYEPGRPPGAR